MNDTRFSQDPHKIRSASSRKRVIHRAIMEALETRNLLSGAVVGIAALDNSAAEASLATGKFRLTRSELPTLEQMISLT